MHGATEAYLDSLSLGDKQVTPKITPDASRIEHTYSKNSGQWKFAAHYLQGQLWVKCTMLWPDEDNCIEEFLRCVDRKNGIFRLTDRLVHGSVGMTSVVRRHNKYPQGSLVKLG